MRILITGGAGFIGSHLCDRLIAEGSRIICLDSLITGTRDNISRLIDNPNFKFIQHDVTKSIQVDEPLDYVLHFASPASPVDYLKYPIQTLKVGSLGTHNTLGLAKAKGAKFILASTSEIYGDPLVHPQREDYYGNVNCIGPRGVYDESKRFAEALTMAYHRTHKIDTKIARIFNTYGERTRKDDGRAIPNFITQALRNEPITVYGDGLQTRSFCYISDLIEGICLLMNSSNSSNSSNSINPSNFINDPINLGNPTEITIKELANKIIELTKSKSKIAFQPLPTDDPRVRCPDITQAQRLLGWEPKISLEEGLKKTIKWFDSQSKM